MAYTSYGVNDTLAVKAWAKDLAVEALKASEIAPLIGKSSNAIIQEKTELKKGPGDRITVGLRMQLSGAGFTENEVAEGNGESLTTYSDNIFINELGHVVGLKSDNTIDAQRIPFDMRSEAKDGLADWFARRLSVSFFNQVCGNTAQTNTKYTGLNSVTAPTSGRILRPTVDSNTTDADLASATDDKMTLALIDRAVELAKTGGTNGLPKIRPVTVDGMGDMYVLYMHPSQVTTIRTDTSTGQWFDIQKAALMGGERTKNPIFTGALGVYNGVVLRESEQIPQGVNASGVAVANTRRAVLLGAQAAVLATGQNSSATSYRWNEELYDHKRKLEVSAWTIMGLKKCVWNSSDFATIVISTYAAHAA